MLIPLPFPPAAGPWTRSSYYPDPNPITTHVNSAVESHYPPSILCSTSFLYILGTRSSAPIGAVLSDLFTILLLQSFCERVFFCPGKGMMTSQVVKIRKEALAACMMCPLCNKLLREATTISLCLHTFCRKCIHKKLSDEELDTCPVCDIDLGCVPVEKLRPDHGLQDIRAKIFPLKRSQMKSTEVVPSISSPVKRKERSLSSLVVSTPKVSAQTGVTGKRTKSTARKTAPFRGSNFSIETSLKKMEVPLEDALEGPSSDEILNKDLQDIKQLPKKEDNNCDKTREPGVDLWKPLNCLVEVANRSKSIPQGSFSVRPEPTTSALKRGENLTEVKINKDHVPHESQVQEDKNGNSTMLRLVKRKRLCAVDWRSSSAQAVVDSHGAKQIGMCPIWFSLVASDDQEGDIPLPQPPPCYLRIRDGNLPVSFIQKYLVKKLGLTSEAEVEILCHGQPVIPTLRLRSLLDLWSQLELSPSKRVRMCVGSSAKEFVMALSYSRRIVPSLAN